jgi:hypothetical protein
MNYSNGWAPFNLIVPNNKLHVDNNRPRFELVSRY